MLQTCQLFFFKKQIARHKKVEDTMDTKFCIAWDLRNKAWIFKYSFRYLWKILLILLHYEFSIHLLVHLQNPICSWQFTFQFNLLLTTQEWELPNIQQVKKLMGKKRPKILI